MALSKWTDVNVPLREPVNSLWAKMYACRSEPEQKRVGSSIWLASVAVLTWQIRVPIQEQVFDLALD